MEETLKWFETDLAHNIINSIIVILVSVIIYNIVHIIFAKGREKTPDKKISKKNKTYFRVFSNIVKVFYIMFVVLVVLKINGVNVDSILAGAGILSIVMGFAIQDALKDIVRGSTILSDHYFQVGDVVKYKDTMGQVVSVGLNTTKIKDLITFNIISIANRNIEQIEVVSDSLDVIVPMPFELKLVDAAKVMNEIVDRVRELEGIIGVDYKGVSKIDEFAINYYLNVHCEPVKRRQINRNVNGVILKTLEDNNIKIPYRQIDIHNK